MKALILDKEKAITFETDDKPLKKTIKLIDGIYKKYHGYTPLKIKSEEL